MTSEDAYGSGHARFWVIRNLIAREVGHEEWLDYHQYEDIRTLINNRQNNRRRGRGGGPRPNGANPGNDRGNRIDNRARGNANQLFEKYKTLARDAQMQGDRVMSEYYFQFADHYFRVLSENRPRFEEQNRGRPDQPDRDDQYDYADEGEAQSETGVTSYGNRDVRQPQQQPQVRPITDGMPVTINTDEEPAPYQANGNSAVDKVEVESARGNRPRRGRPRKDAPAADLLAGVDQGQVEEARIEIDRLPPAFAPDGADVVAEKPKRRGRRPRAESEAAEV